MAPAVATLARWADESVGVAAVVGALERLRRPEPMPATRTSVLTLVVVAEEPASAARAQLALEELGSRHPARVLTLVVDPDGRPAGLDAEVRLLGGRASDREVWFEAIDLAVRGPASAHLSSLIAPFTLADLPVVAWFVDGLPEPDDPLLAGVDVLLVDARDFGDTACFARLDGLLGRPLVDLSWQRLRPWRELLAGLFETEGARGFLAGFRAVRVGGRAGPRHLLAGWIADRLDVPADRVHLDAADHLSIRIVSVDRRGREARFEVGRGDGDRVVRAQAHVEGGPTSAVAVALADDTPGWGLADALGRLEPDPVYAGALREAIVLSRR